MRVLLQAVLLSAVFGLGGTSVAQTPNSTPATFSIKISTPQDLVKVGSDVIWEIAMTNTSSGDIYYAWGAGPILNIEIHDAEGKPAPETPRGLRIHGKDPRFALQDSAREPVIRRTLHPGESDVSKGSLNIVYDLSRPGKYTIQVQRMDPKSKVLVKSNTITVTVIP